MSYAYKIYDQNGLYFITCTVVQWVDVFSRKQYADIIVDSLNYWARFRAQAWLTLYDGRDFENPMLYPEDEEARPVIKGEQQQQPLIAAALPNDKLYPNPVHESLSVEVQAESTFQLCDLAGRVLLQEDLKTGLNKLSIKLPTGLYQYRIWQDGLLKHKGKLLKD